MHFVCEHLSLVCEHLPLTRDFCVNVNATALVAWALAVVADDGSVQL